jgi:hypothetical protein
MAKQALIILVIVLVFGVLVPWYRGLSFLDSMTIVVYACMSLLFVAPTAAETFGAPASTRSSIDILPRTGMILAYGWGTSVLMLAAGVLTVNFAYWQGRMLTPPVATLGSALLLGFTASVAMIAATALMARQLGPRTTKNILRVLFLLLLLAWRFTADPHLTSGEIQRLCLIASGIFAVVAIILLGRLLRGSTASVEAAQ